MADNHGAPVEPESDLPVSPPEEPQVGPTSAPEEPVPEPRPAVEHNPEPTAAAAEVHKESGAPADAVPPPESEAAKDEERKKSFADKKKRRKSMFEEAEDVKTLLAPPPGGDLTATLQTFFTHQSLSAENVVQKPLRRPKLIYENTFRLEPSKPFSATRTETVIHATLTEMLENYKYNSNTVLTISGKVAEKIRSRLLSYRFDRYKLIVMVTISSMTRQGIHQGFRCLWDPNRDSYAHGSFKNVSIFAIACVYAIYYE